MGDCVYHVVRDATSNDPSLLLMQCVPPAVGTYLNNCNTTAMLQFKRTNVKQVVELAEVQNSELVGLAIFSDGTQAMFSVTKHLESDGATPRFCDADGNLNAGWKVEGDWLRDPAVQRGGLSLATLKRKSLGDE